MSSYSCILTFQHNPTGDNSTTSFDVRKRQNAFNYTGIHTQNTLFSLKSFLKISKCTLHLILNLFMYFNIL